MSSQRVTVRHVTKYQFTADFPEVAGAPSIALDEAPPTGDGRGPNPAALLGAAVGTCLSATLVGCLRRAGAEAMALTANVVTHVRRNAEGRYRVAGIDVEMTPQLTASNRDSLERCERVFHDFCTVTESVRHGIPVQVTFQSVERAAEATMDETAR